MTIRLVADYDVSTPLQINSPLEPVLSPLCPEFSFTHNFSQIHLVLHFHFLFDLPGYLFPRHFSPKLYSS